MSPDQESSEEFLERLVRESRRANYIHYGLLVAPAALVLLSLLGAWVFGSKPLWVQIFVWSSQVILLLSFVLIALQGIKPVRVFLWGPERELSEEEKSDRAKRELVQKELDKLVRPISWAYSISGCIFLITMIQWFVGEFVMTVPLGIAMSGLAAIAGLTLWAQQRISVYFHNHQ